MKNSLNRFKQFEIGAKNINGSSSLPECGCNGTSGAWGFLCRTIEAVGDTIIGHECEADDWW